MTDQEVCETIRNILTPTAGEIRDGCDLVSIQLDFEHLKSRRVRVTDVRMIGYFL
jgi:hypothetical protein